MNRRRALLLVPLGGAVAAGAAFYAMLRGMQSGQFDPRGVPSPMIGKTVPPFRLDGLADTDLAAGHPVLVNFFASWCAPCIEEAPVLMGLKKQGVPIIGVAYKDRPSDTDAFLARFGNPFLRFARDLPGRVAIDWGVYGVPETYVVDGGGVMRWKYAGALTPEIVERAVLPLVKQYV